MRQTWLFSPAQGRYVVFKFTHCSHCVLLSALTYALSPTPFITHHTIHRYMRADFLEEKVPSEMEVNLDSGDGTLAVSEEFVAHVSACLLEIAKESINLAKTRRELRNKASMSASAGGGGAKASVRDSSHSICPTSSASVSVSAPKLLRKSSDESTSDEFAADLQDRATELGDMSHTGGDSNSNSNSSSSARVVVVDGENIDYSFVPEPHTGPRARSRTSSSDKDKDEIRSPPRSRVNSTSASTSGSVSISAGGSGSGSGSQPVSMCVADLNSQSHPLLSKEEQRLPQPIEKVWNVLSRTEGGSGLTLGQAWVGGYCSVRAWVCSVVVWGNRTAQLTKPVGTLTLKRAVQTITELCEKEYPLSLGQNRTILYLRDALAALHARIDAGLGPGGSRSDKHGRLVREYVGVMLYVYSYGQYSMLLLSYSISSGALGSSDLLLSYSVITVPLHNTIILIITHLSNFNP